MIPSSDGPATGGETGNSVVMSSPERHLIRSAFPNSNMAVAESLCKDNFSPKDETESIFSTKKIDRFLENLEIQQFCDSALTLKYQDDVLQHLEQEVSYFLFQTTDQLLSLQVPTCVLPHCNIPWLIIARLKSAK